jgi:hypothetical protein
MNNNFKKTDVYVSEYWRNIKNRLLGKLSNNYNVWIVFWWRDEDWFEECFIDNVFVRMYICEKECTLDEAIEWSIKQDFSGQWNFEWNLDWYSEYTIEWFNVNDFTIWNHDLNEILKWSEDKFVHLIMSF